MPEPAISLQNFEGLSGPSDGEIKEADLAVRPLPAHPHAAEATARGQNFGSVSP